MKKFRVSVWKIETLPFPQDWEGGGTLLWWVVKTDRWGIWVGQVGLDQRPSYEVSEIFFSAPFLESDFFFLAVDFSRIIFAGICGRFFVLFWRPGQGEWADAGFRRFRHRADSWLNNGSVSAWFWRKLNHEVLELCHEMMMGLQWNVCFVKLCWDLGRRRLHWLAEECHPWRADWDDVLTADRHHGADRTIKGIWNSNPWRCCCCDALWLASRCPVDPDPQWVWILVFTEVHHSPH